MHRVILWIVLGILTFSACASEPPPPMETDTDTSDPQRIPEILSSFKPGERLEVWASNGECFEAAFVSCDTSTLAVDKKSYERVYQRDHNGHRNQTEYGVKELVRVRAASPQGRVSSPPFPILGIVVVTAISTIAFWWLLSLVI